MYGFYKKGLDYMKKLKYTIPGQMLSIAGAHIITSFIFFFIWLVTAGVWEGIAGKIFSLVGLICYLISIYNASVNCAQADKRTVSPLTPHPWKGFVLPIFLLVFNALIVFMYKYAWSVAGDGEFLRQGWAVFLNMLAVFWTAAYENLLGMTRGALSAGGYFIIFVLPIAATAGGYFAGFKGFDLFAKISGIAYEKNEKK